MSGLQHNLQFLLRGHLHGIQAAFRKRGRRGREKEGEDDGEGEMTVLNWTLSMWNKDIYQDLQHHLFSFSEMSFLWSTGIWCIWYKICWAEPFLQRVMRTVSAGQPTNLTSPQLMQNLSFSLRVDRRTPAAYCELKPQVIYAVTCNQEWQETHFGMHWMDSLIIFTFVFYGLVSWNTEPWRHLPCATISCSSHRCSTAILQNLLSDSPLHIFHVLCKDKRLWTLAF